MRALLPVLDDFDRAYVEISKTEEKDLLKGVELISNKLKTTLEQKGLSALKVSVGVITSYSIHYTKLYE